MLTPLNKNRTNAHKYVFVWFDFRKANLSRQNWFINLYLFLSFVPAPSPALLTYEGISFAQLGGFGGFMYYDFCMPISIVLLTDKVN